MDRRDLRLYLSARKSPLVNQFKIKSKNFAYIIRVFMLLLQLMHVSSKDRWYGKHELKITRFKTVNHYSITSYTKQLRVG